MIKRINYQENIKRCSMGLKIVFKKGFDKMNLKEYKKYVHEVNNNIKNLLKDNKEELSFYQLLVNTFNQVCEERNNLEQALDESEKLINTILNFSFFKEECPLNFSFEDNSKEDKAQNIFYSDEYCENNCNDIYKDCWLKYFKELQKAKGDVRR